MRPLYWHYFQPYLRPAATTIVTKTTLQNWILALMSSCQIRNYESEGSLSLEHLSTLCHEPVALTSVIVHKTWERGVLFIQLWGLCFQSSTRNGYSAKDSRCKIFDIRKFNVVLEQNYALQIVSKVPLIIHLQFYLKFYLSSIIVSALILRNLQ